MRYTVNDLPANAVGAFCPIPAVDPIGGLWGSMQVWGSPGTDPVASPRPINGRTTNTNQGGVNTASGSDVAPDDWFPSIYVALADNQGPEADAGIGMSRRRYAELPIPAGNPTRVAASDTFQTKKGGRLTQAWPRAFQRFPTAP